MNLITERFPIKLSLANVLFASLLAACGGEKVADGQAQQNSNGVAQNEATLTEQEKSVADLSHLTVPPALLALALRVLQERQLGCHV